MVFFASAEPSVAEKAHLTYVAARERYAAETNNPEASWQLGRACFDRAEYAGSDADRARIATEGINVCRQVIARSPKLAAAHYYLGMNLGQLARTKSLGALKLVNEMESEFKLVLQLDPNFDYAGADRNLGLLYLDAPGWPVSIGSRSKARQHLSRAIELHPEYPDNYINLIEAHLKWNDRSEAQQAYTQLESRLPQSHILFSGPQWASSWSDWQKRIENIQSKLKMGTQGTTLGVVVGQPSPVK